jgi:hypothetical protein
MPGIGSDGLRGFGGGLEQQLDRAKGLQRHPCIERDGVELPRNHLCCHALQIEI